MQAFEAFDRKVNPGTLTSPEKFKEVYDAMVGAIPQGTANGLRQKMKAAIQYANEPSLRKRLKLFHDFLVSLIGSEPYGFKSSGIEQLVQTRNYFTHYPEDLKDKILSPSSTVRETERFSMLLVVCLLHEIGVTLDQTRNGLFLHDKFRRFMDGKGAPAGPETPT
ncbi:MAG: HEPN domain-containing protein [Hoeflea sp.]|uniref:HEPN domain-containing protein n=1 Tax=Hoeflea sp. TaxID=1940281 RepID=UPI003EF71543